MTNSDWFRIDKLLRDPDVKIAMRARCEEQNHQWENGADFFPVPCVFLVCRWCGERK